MSQIEIHRLADRAAIVDCIYRYCRGIDRADWNLVTSAYWPDAEDDHGMFVGTAADFVNWLSTYQPSMVRSTHMIGNVLVQIEGAAAEAESYFSAYATIGTDSGTHDQLVTGRYLDRFTNREGLWKIASRKVIYDWYRIFDGTQYAKDVPYAPGAKSGQSSRADLSYEFLSPFWHSGMV